MDSDSTDRTKGCNVEDWMRPYERRRSDGNGERWYAVVAATDYLTGPSLLLRLKPTSHPGVGMSLRTGDTSFDLQIRVCGF